MIQNESQTRLKASQMMRRPITWTQISLEASEDLRGLIGREPKAAQLVLALIEQMEPGGGGIVVASRTTMAELIGASVPTVARALRVLMNEGWVQRIALAVRQLWQSIAVWPGLAPAATCRTLFSVQPSLRHVPSKTQSPWPPPQMRRIPTIRRGEEPLLDGPGQEPPSQPELAGIPPVVATASAQAELEARGQLRIDLSTGEIIAGLQRPEV